MFSYSSAVKKLFTQWSDTMDPILEAIKTGPKMDLMEALHEQAA